MSKDRFRIWTGRDENNTPKVEKILDRKTGRTYRPSNEEHPHLADEESGEVMKILDSIALAWSVRKEIKRIQRQEHDDGQD